MKDEKKKTSSSPNFLIAGGVATGTSFLSATLAQHPDIYLPRVQRPEPNFFHYSWKYEQGMDWYLKSWFHEVKNEHAIGERSSLMLPSASAPKRLKQAFPEIKLIFCLRNPIERAWANYRFTVLEGLEPLSFDEAIDAEENRIKAATGKWAEVQPHAYINRSKYSTSLREYFELFEKKQVMLLKSEELGRRPHETIKRVCDFLNVDSSLQLSLPANYSSPSVADHATQTKLRAYFGDRFPDLIECIRKEENMERFIRTEEDSQKISMLRSNLSGGKDPISEKSRKRVRELLSDEISELKQMVDFSVEDWT